jgi:hypothetical protein
VLQPLAEQLLIHLAVLQSKPAAVLQLLANQPAVLQ